MESDEKSSEVLNLKCAKTEVVYFNSLKPR